MTSTFATAVAALLVTAVLAVFSARRAAYERVMTALEHVSGGTVASARHRLGSIIYDEHDRLLAGATIFDPQAQQQERSDRIEDLFTVFWAATGLDAVRQSLGPRWFDLGRGPHHLLEESVSTWVKYWTQPLESCKPRLLRYEAVAHSLGASVDDDDTAGLRRLQNAWSSTRN